MPLQDSNNWRKGRKCLFRNTVHLIFLTKYKHSVFTQEILERLKEIFIETCQQMECHLVAFQGDTHYVHLVVSIPPKIAISILVGKLKAKSSYLLTKEFPEHLKNKTQKKHLWSPSYCAISHGDNVLQSIEDFFLLDLQE